MVYDVDYIIYMQGNKPIVEFDNKYLPEKFFQTCHELGYEVIKTYNNLSFPYSMQCKLSEFIDLLNLSE
jgi:hypothetical protein